MDPYYEQQRRIEEEKEEKRIKKLEKKNIKAKQPKKVQCPKCNNIVITYVKEECNIVALVLLLLPPLFLIACCCVYEHKRQCFCTKTVHRCPSCNADCTKQKALQDENSSISCNII